MTQEYSEKIIVAIHDRHKSTSCKSLQGKEIQPVSLYLYHRTAIFQNPGGFHVL